jgi:predicted RNA-binding protein Jag
MRHDVLSNFDSSYPAASQLTEHAGKRNDLLMDIAGYRQRRKNPLMHCT